MITTVLFFRPGTKGCEGVSGRDQSQFRGPEGLLNFSDKHSLKKFTIEIVRKPSIPRDDNHVNRNITNTDDIVPVRRSGELVNSLNIFTYCFFALKYYTNT